VPDTSGLSFGNGATDSPFSISAWVKMNDATRFRIVSKLNGSNAEYAFFTSAADQLYFVLYDNTTSNRISRYTSSTLTSYEGTWIHLVATYSGSGSSNGLKIYLDNARIDNSVSDVGAYNAMHNTNAIFEIGKYTTSSANGLIDEVSVFNSELSQSDITAIYNNGEPQSLDAYSPFVWFRMGDNATWNGFAWTMTSVGTDTRIARSANMVEANRTTDVPTIPFSTKSIALDGVDDFVNISNAITLVDDFSISAWIKPSNTTDTYNMILSCGSVGPYFAVRSGGKLHFYLSSTYETGAGVIAPNVWSHVAVTRTSGVLQLYINGAAFGSTSTQSNVIGSQTYNIGRYAPTSGFQFTGNIDELALFNSSLSASDITSIYNSGVPNDISSLSPLSWWRCGDGDTAPTLTDNGSASNDGTMTNFSTFSTDVPT